MFFMQNPDSSFDNQKVNLYKTNRPEFDKNEKVIKNKKKCQDTLHKDEPN